VDTQDGTNFRQDNQAMRESDVSKKKMMNSFRFDNVAGDKGQLACIECVEFAKLKSNLIITYHIQQGLGWA
jgi:hypothetical protein